MKRSAITILYCLIAPIFLLGCNAINRYPYPREDLTHEQWQYQLNSQSKSFKSGASHWFLSNGDANLTERNNLRAPLSSETSMMQVKVPPFNKIKVNGLFQVQIFGTYGAPSVAILGPNRGVRSTAVEVQDKTLLLFQTAPAPGDIEQTIIRVGVNRLDELIQQGCGPIEGIYIKSRCLKIKTEPGGNGNIYLNGNYVLNDVTHESAGKISLLNARAHHLDIDTIGSGTLNIHGRIAIRSLMHRNSGDIAIVGAKTLRPLDILAYGNGTVTINGEVNLHHVKAGGNIALYLYHVNSQRVIADLYHHANVGLAGQTSQLEVTTKDDSLFQGRYLVSRYALASAYQNSHINITARDKIFARAHDNASIYYFGQTPLITQFLAGRGTVIPVGTDGLHTYPGFDTQYRISPDYNSKVPQAALKKTPKVIKVR